MAAGDRNKKGKPKDIVRHFKLREAKQTVCGRKKWGYASDDKTETNCILCNKKI